MKHLLYITNKLRPIWNKLVSRRILQRGTRTKEGRNAHGTIVMFAMCSSCTASSIGSNSQLDESILDDTCIYGVDRGFEAFHGACGWGGC